MKQRVQYLLFIWLFTTVGCFELPGVYTPDPVLDGNSKECDSLIGNWVSNPSNSKGIFPYHIKISKAEGDQALLAKITSPAASDKSNDEIKLRVRTKTCFSSDMQAVVEFEHSVDGEVNFRRLGIVSFDEDRMNLWLIDGRKLGKHLYADGHNAVLEHDKSLTVAHCDRERLLDTIKRHTIDLVGDKYAFSRLKENIDGMHPEPSKH